MAKPKRLSKVAREFNLGLSTVVEFLTKKGFEVESNPNTKLDPEMYDVLVQEFQSDKSLKEKSEKIEIKKTKKETISIDDQVEEKEPQKPENEEPELIIKDATAPENPLDDKEEEEKKSTGPKVVGKIDLPKDKKKEAKKAAEEKKQEEKKQEEKKAAEEKKVEEKKAEEEKKEAPKKEEAPKEEAPKPEAKKEDEVVKAKADKLTGPKVLGKIELPVDKKKEELEEKKRRRKRKRIKKENPTAAGKDDARQPRGRGPRRPREEKAELTDEEIQKQIKETLARLSGGKQKKKSAAKFRREKRDSAAMRKAEELEKAEQEKTVLKASEFVSANELANMMDVSVNEIISACMSLGLFVSINQRLDAETITIVAEEFGYEVSFVDAEEQAVIEEEEDAEEDLLHRAPIITVMGHVDHGKTSLLDKIRKANVVAGEAGGITQHIGAYSVLLENEKRVTFLDTPGHEAFTAMRARGAKVTDIAIIIIAADDNVMPQTKEAINHAQAAGVPMIFAINKIDKPGANPDKIREELANMNILVEDWGGKYQCQEISAKNDIGIEDLLEKVLLEAELMELKANPDKLAKGTVIESSLDKGRGYVATVLIENGTLNIGDMVVAGSYYGKIKAMFDDLGQKATVAGPAIPVQILGLNGAPQAGDTLNAMEDEKEAKDIANKRLQIIREQGIRTQKHVTLDEIGRRIAVGNFKELNLIVKGDVDGSIEALSDSLLKLSTDQIQVNIIHKSVGQITESDVLLASASDAIIIGFQVRPSGNARSIADREEIEIRLYSIIYDAIEEVRQAMEGMLAPTIEEKVVANVEIRETFKISKVGTVAGCYVLDGKINRNNKIRIIREGIVKYDGELGSLKRFKDDVKEVAAGYECGLNVDKYNDIKEGDIIEAYEEVEVATKLK
jgi:translation initiation factor IF-2